MQNPSPFFIIFFVLIAYVLLIIEIGAMPYLAGAVAIFGIAALLFGD